MKVKRKIKWKNLIIILFLFFSITCIIVSAVNIIKWFIDNNETDKIVSKIEGVIKIEEVTDGEHTEVIEQIEEVPESNPYWDYIKMNLINVNFDELKNINSSTVGWIQVNGTNINYPFVQTTDNNYYLNHSFDKTSNGGGWVFLDYRNNLSTLDKNIIIYAHGRSNKTMFGTLKNILTSNWINDTNNFVVKLSTEYENTLWQVFSVYRIPNTNDYIRVNFKNNENFLEFANMLMKMIIS